jgi:antitoxin StbD
MGTKYDTCILSNMVASLSGLKKHPMATVSNAKGNPLAILNRNEPVFYYIMQKPMSL